MSRLGASDLILGVDGGGTSTTALLADSAGRVLGRGEAGPSNPKAIGFAAAFGALEAATAEAFTAAGRPVEGVAAACLGLAGFAQVEDRRRLQAWADARGLARRLLPVSDGALVLAAGTPDGAGVAVIAGTGSIAVGADRAGNVARAGGWGWRFGDEGSAHNVVLDALRRSARRADGREPDPFGGDPLTRALMAALGVAEPAELIAAVYDPSMDRTRLAALAPAVLDAARLDPTIEADLLRPAGRDLGATAAAVARSLNWNEPTLPVALAGGFLLRAEIIQQGLLDHLRALGFDPRPIAVADPALGALILARRAVEGEGPAP